MWMFLDFGHWLTHVSFAVVGLWRNVYDGWKEKPLWARIFYASEKLSQAKGDSQDLESGRVWERRAIEVYLSHVANVKHIRMLWPSGQERVYSCLAVQQSLPICIPS